MAGKNRMCLLLVLLFGMFFAACSTQESEAPIGDNRLPLHTHTPEIPELPGVYYRVYGNEEIMVYMNEKPQTVKTVQGIVQATPLEGCICDGEFELVIPRWGCMDELWWAEESENITVLSTEIILDGREYPEDEVGHFPDMQRMRIGVKAGTSGPFKVETICGNDSCKHAFLVEYECPETFSASKEPESMRYERSKEPERMILYIDGELHSVDLSEPEITIPLKEKDCVERIYTVVLPLWENQTEEWEVVDYFHRTWVNKKELLLNESPEGELSYMRLLDVKVLGENNGSFILRTKDGTTGKYIKIEVVYEK